MSPPVWHHVSCSLGSSIRVHLRSHANRMSQQCCSARGNLPPHPPVYGSQKLRIRGLLVPAGLRQHHTVLLGSSWLGFPGGAERTRQILRQNLDAPSIVTADAQVHVTQESVELHPCPCLTTHSREHSVGGDLFLICPVCVQACPVSSEWASGLWHLLHVASVKGNGSCKRSSNRTL